MNRTESRIEDKEGDYIGRAIAGSEKWHWTSNNNPELSLDFRVELGAGRMNVVTLYFVLAPAREPGAKASADIAIEQLRECGWTGSDIRRLDGIDRNRVKLRAKANLFNGKQSLRWSVLTGTGSDKEPMTDQELAKVAGDFRLYMTAGLEGSGATRQAEEREPGSD
jgi:hypothetical protein